MSKLKYFEHFKRILEDLHLERFGYIIHVTPNVIIEDTVVLLSHGFTKFKPYLPLKMFA